MMTFTRITLMLWLLLVGGLLAAAIIWEWPLTAPFIFVGAAWIARRWWRSVSEARQAVKYEQEITADLQLMETLARTMDLRPLTKRQEIVFWECYERLVNRMMYDDRAERVVYVMDTYLPVKIKAGRITDPDNLYEAYHELLYPV